MHVTPPNQRTVTFSDRPALIHSPSEAPYSMAQHISAVTQSSPAQQTSPFQQKLPEIKAQDRIEGLQFKLAVQQRIRDPIGR